jgi:hypothetical protein
MSRYVVVHHTAVCDGHSAGYEVVQNVLFVICHVKEGWMKWRGAKWRQEAKAK